MKRIFFIFVFAVLMICPVIAQESRSRQANEEVGPVQTVRVERAELSKKSGKVEEGERILISTSTYDQRGNLVESSINRRDGSPFKKYSARYTADLGRVEESYTDPAGALDTKFVTAYDPAAKQAETTGFDAKGKAITRSVYRFDDSGRIAEEVRYGKGSHVDNRTVFTYAAGANKVERTLSDAQGRAQYRAVTTLNPQGKPADEKFYRPDGSLIFQTHCLYDDRGNCYDELIDLGGGGLHWRYDYDYDARGNWTKRRTLKQTLNMGLPEYGPVEVTYRTITYFQPADDKPAQAPVSELERNRGQATAALLLGDAVEHQLPFDPGRTVGTNVAGQITVLMMIDEQGGVLFARCLSGFDKLLNDLAETVTNRRKYNPVLRGGRMATAIDTITFEYKPDFR
jgi:hypothetical protein